MKRVFYSLMEDQNDRYLNQWRCSIQSLRAYNNDTDVHLFVYNRPTNLLLREADRYRVRLHCMEDCEKILNVSPHAAVLKLYPTLHKFITLCQASALNTDQVLLLDCDTYFYADVDLIFKRYTAFHWYAREEPGSRQSQLGLDAAAIDEDALDKLTQHEKLRRIFSFNTGVCLLNHGVWHALEELLPTYLDNVWRLLVGRHAAVSLEYLSGHALSVHRAVISSATDLDKASALPYPSANDWIIDQIALWLTLGRLPWVTVGMLSPEHVCQGREFIEGYAPPASCIIVHYFSSNESDFLAARASSALLKRLAELNLRLF